MIKYVDQSVSLFLSWAMFGKVPKKLHKNERFQDFSILNFLNLRGSMNLYFDYLDLQFMKHIVHNETKCILANFEPLLLE